MPRDKSIGLRKVFARHRLIDDERLCAVHLIEGHDIAVRRTQVLRDAGAVVEHVYVNFYYDIFPESKKVMKDLNVRLHHLATWWDVLRVVKQGQYLAAAQVGELSLALNAGRHTTTTTSWYWLDARHEAAVLDRDGATRADVAALGGRHAAHAMHDFLATDAWPERPPIPVRCEPPVRWVSPSAVNVGVEPPHGRFILRVSECCGHSALVVSQGPRVLWRRRCRSLVPSLPIHVAGGFVSQVEAGGPPLTFRLEGDR